MNEYKKEDIRNIHYNNHNEIQFEYGGQVHHCNMEHLKEILVSYRNLQQENRQLKEKEELHLNRIDELTDRVVELQAKVKQLELNRDEVFSKEKMETLLKELQKLDKCDTALESSLMLKRKHLENELLKRKNQKYKEVIDKVINELFDLKDMIYKPETREENFDIQGKITSIIINLNVKEVE